MTKSNRSSITSILKERWASEGLMGSPRLFFCPGRVNLIGEHIDYNGGLVFPAAIDRGVYALFSPRTDSTLTLRSLNRPDEAFTLNCSDIARVRAEHADSWVAYPLATLEILEQQGHAVSGADIMFYGDLPLGAGLSSSAAIEVLTAYMAKCFDPRNPGRVANINRVELALGCQRAEREIIGVQCGIMDQFSVANAKSGRALALNCATLEHTYIPFDFENFRLVVIDSKKERSLAGSKYNERRAECDAALELIRKLRAVENLCQATITEVNQALANEPLLLKRARHVVTENRRVYDAMEALKAGNFQLFGELLYQSHDSLKNDYEVTGRELDALVDLSSQIEGCIGARMTGAGFGGCVIALVEVSCIANFERELLSAYSSRCGIAGECFASSASDGVSELDL